MRALTLSILTIAVTITAAIGASALDETVCFNGPLIRALDLPTYVQGIEERLVACVNYLRDQQDMNTEAQVLDMRDVRDRLADLEARMDAIEAK